MIIGGMMDSRRTYELTVQRDSLNGTGLLFDVRFISITKSLIYIIKIIKCTNGFDYYMVNS